MQVRDIMSKEIISVSPEETVSKFISLIEKHHIHEALVCDNKKLLGIVYSKNIIAKGITDPSTTKIRSIMNFPSAHVSPEDDVEVATDLIFKTGLRALPVCEKNKVLGIISIFDLMEMAAKSKQFRQTTVDLVAPLPDVMMSNYDIGKARVLMREKNISHLPIVDRDGNLAGIVTTFDLLKAVKPRERIGWYSMSGEMEKIMNIPISTVMNKNPVTANKKASLSEVANLMSRYKISGIVITENKMPVGIVTPKDLLEIYISGFRQKGVYYQIMGLTNEDSFIVDTVDMMIRDTIEKVSNIYKPEFFFVHVKKHYTGDKERMRYYVRTRFRTNKGIFISKASEWDLRDAVNQALGHLERIMIRQKDFAKDKIKKNISRFKGRF